MERLAPPPWPCLVEDADVGLALTSDTPPVTSVMALGGPGEEGNEMLSAT